MFQQLFQLYYLKDLDKLDNYEVINMASTHDYIKDIRNENIKIYINGKFYHRSEAKISVFDSGFLLGDGVWEGIRLHNGTLIHLDNHIDRLFAVSYTHLTLPTIYSV